MHGGHDRPDPGPDYTRPTGDGQPDDFVERCLAALLGALGGLVWAIGVPLWRLVRFIVYDWWAKDPNTWNENL